MEIISYENLISSIIQAIKYSDYYDYPLKIEEIHKQISCEISLKDLTKILKKDKILKSTLTQNSGYFFLHNRVNIIKIRKSRKKISKMQWEQIIPAIKLMIKLPFIKMIAITGSLSMDNSDIDSDIDFLIITSPKRVWITRLLLFIVEKYSERVSSRKINLCFNFIIAKSNPSQFPKSLYVAHEIMQMKPIFGFSEYNNFLSKNIWVYNYLPNLRSVENEKKSWNRNPEQSTFPCGLINRINRSKGVLFRLLNFIDYIEYRRATSKIYQNFKFTEETRFSRSEYKAHFANNQKKIEKILKRNDKIFD